MEKAQKIALFFLLTMGVASTASAVIAGKKADGPRKDFQIERSRAPTDPVPDHKPSNRTGEPTGGFNEDIMSQTR